MFINRFIKNKLENALKQSPVVLLVGARQTGKTTLIKKIGEERGYHYVTFDNLGYLSAAKSDPMGFIKNLKKPVILDEIQRVPELFLPIKSCVDQNSNPGDFILTGSSNPLLLQALGDSLAGRMEIIKLFPLSQGEVLNKKESFVDKVFSHEISTLESVEILRSDLCDKFLLGGYPRVQNKSFQSARNWFNSYLETILQKDVQELSRIEGLSQLPNLLSLIATRVGGLLNSSELSRISDIPSTTMRRYLTLLKTLYLISTNPVWSKNLGKRLVKSPKVYLLDTGLLLHLIRADKQRLLDEPTLFGKVLENFVISEIWKQTSWSTLNPQVFHFRTQTGMEVDIVLESLSGKVVGIEVKGSQTVSSDDFKWLKQFRDSVGKNFMNGVVLYLGSDIIPFGNNLWAVPVSCLWG